MVANQVEVRDTTVHREVRLLRWPTQQALREECRSRGVPRILVVEAGRGAPVCDDIYEDWVRPPVASHDLRVRVDALVHRYRRNRWPQLEDGVLRFASESVTLSPKQAELLSLLVPRFGQVVPHEEVRHHLGKDAACLSRNALDLHMMRIRQRISLLGLTVRTVWGRGYILDTSKEGTS